MRKKVLLAIKNIDLEKYIESKISSTHEVVGGLVHRDGIIQAVKDKEPDILVVRETLPGKEDLLRTIHYLSGNHPDLRVVFIAKERPIGDAVLASLVSFKVYDILTGSRVRADEIIDLIKHPNDYVDVQHFLPAPSYDEETGKLLFEAPEIKRDPKFIEVQKPIRTNTSESMELDNSHSSDTDEIPSFNNKPSEDVEKDIDEKKRKKENPFKEFFSSLSGPNNTKSHVSDVEKKHTNNVESFSVGTNGIGKKLITFIGGKSGVGTTTMAINIATLLANEGKNVIFLELDRSTPSVAYWYDLGSPRKGIDTALTAINKRDYKKVVDSIVKMASVKKDPNKTLVNYKQYPSSIDFMSFSNRYLGNIERDKVDLSNPKELYLYLLLQMDYDYVILDAGSNLYDELTMDAIMYSNIIFTVITQDIATVGYQQHKIMLLEESGINIKNKNNYIINKYIDSSFDAKEISDWLDLKSATLMPYAGSVFIEANYNGLPAVLYGCTNNVNNAFKNIESIIYNFG